MLITDKGALKNYASDMHLWVGIPGIEVTAGGTTWMTCYSGGTREEIENYCMLFRSRDGKAFGDPVAVSYREGYRCFDPCLWTDPMGRLWFIWSRCPEDGVFASICEEPDREEPVFGPEFFIGNNVMMNKPTVLSAGEWLFPVAVWKKGIGPLAAVYEPPAEESGAFAYVTVDGGRSFQKRGFAVIPGRSFDEHMFLERREGSVRCFVRTDYGIGAADSFDGGSSWGAGFDTGYGGPCTRFHIRRLPSGRVLMINHWNFTGRNNLTAMLSEDDGKTFPYRLLLDGRGYVSYPDAAVDPDGRIHIVYDRERGCFLNSLGDILASAREILTAGITEEDILAGKLVSEGSWLRRVIYKLTDYNGADPFEGT